MLKRDELLNKIFFKKYEIIRKLGKGSFGLVYLGKIINSNNFVAVKFEPKNQIEHILERESYLLYYLRGFGIPEVITFGHNSKYNVLVQTLLGNSINDIFFQYNKKFSMKDCCMIGLQMLDRLEYIHSKYIIHRDIKPDNFLVGKEDESLIYLIDFGLAKKYMSSRTGKHVKFSINKKWSGTSRFASANSLRGVVQSRRDDLESLCYILLFIMKGNLPWDNVFGYSENDDILLIYKIKKFMSPDLLFFNLPKETSEFFKYCKKLDFDKKPDYNYLRSLLLKILNNQNDKNDLYFSWIINSRGFQSQSEKVNQHIDFNKRKNSPQQRIYNSLLSSKIKYSTKCESVNEVYLLQDFNKIKRDCKPVKNISSSPRQHNKLFNYMIKENYIKKKPNFKKKIINIELNDLRKNTIIKKNNIIAKTQTEAIKKNHKKIKAIALQKLGNNFIKSKEINNNENNIIIFNKALLNNNSLNSVKNFNNKNLIIKRNNLGINDSSQLHSFQIPSIKNYIKILNDERDYKDEDKYDNINFCKNNALDIQSFNQKKNNKNFILKSSFQNKSKNKFNINIIPCSNNDNKIYNENLYFKYINKINNKIAVPKNFKHISPEQINRYRLKAHSDKNSVLSFKVIKNKNMKNKNMKNKNDLIKINIINNNIKNNYNIIKNNNTFILNEKIQCQPQKNIRIINLISRINKNFNYYNKNKNKTFNSKTNLYKNNENRKFYKKFNSNKFTINNIYDNFNKNDNLYNYYSNSTYVDKNKIKEGISKNIKSSFNYENINNKYKDKILKTNSCFSKTNINNVSRNNIININLKKGIISNSPSYVSPKSIEKYKTNI